MSSIVSGANHYTLAVSDLERSFKFYRDVLCLKPLCKWQKGAYFLAGDFWFCLNLDAQRQPVADPHYTHFAFTIAQFDFNDIVARLKEHSVVSFKENTSPGDSFYFMDPDGYRLEIHVGNWRTRLEAFRKERKDVEYFV
jgi:catechol 2,3-dioxygenase-like lactoylglutathione lyase family enzyme